MKLYTVTVTIEAENRKQVEQVLDERLSHDEDYGFDYSIITWSIA